VSVTCGHPGHGVGQGPICVQLTPHDGPTSGSWFGSGAQRAEPHAAILFKSHDHDVPRGDAGRPACNPPGRSSAWDPTGFGGWRTGGIESTTRIHSESFGGAQTAHRS